MIRHRRLSAAVSRALPVQQQGFGLLSIIITTALGAMVIGVAATAYRQTNLSAEAASAAATAAEIAQRVQASYASASNFDLLNNTVALNTGLYPKNVLNPSGQPVNTWGGALELVGSAEGFTLTFENVDPAACPRFVAAAATGWSGVMINGASAMQGARLSAAAAAALCASTTSGGDEVQFLGKRVASGTNPELTACVPPAPQSQMVGCPTGQISSVPPYSANGIKQTRSAFCNGAYGDPGWMPWVTQSNTCAPICTAPAPTLTPQNQSVSSSAVCPAGQTGSDTWTQAQTRTQTVTYACATPVGPLNTNPATYSSWINSGGKIGEVNTCSPTCSTRLASPPWQPQTQAQWVSAGAPCPSGQIGSHTWQAQQIQSRTAACANPAAAVDPVWGGWSAWANTGATSNDVNSCAPACVAPPPSNALQSAACPSGDTGSITEQQTTTWSCPAPTGSAVASVGPWTQVGNNCAASAPPVLTASSVCIWPRNVPANVKCGATGAGSPTVTGKNGIGAVCSASFTVSYDGQSASGTLGGSWAACGVGQGGGCGTSTTVTLAGRAIKVTLQGYWGGTGGDGGPGVGGCSALTVQ